MSVRPAIERRRCFSAVRSRGGTTRYILGPQSPHGTMWHSASPRQEAILRPAGLRCVPRSVGLGDFVRSRPEGGCRDMGPHVQQSLPHIMVCLCARSARVHMPWCSAEGVLAQVLHRLSPSLQRPCRQQLSPHGARSSLMLRSAFRRVHARACCSASRRRWRSRAQHRQRDGQD